jgi:hypothetical protein
MTTFPQPVFILAAPRSFSSVVCAMLGRHPEAYGVPELNLFIADDIKTFWALSSGPLQYMQHGILRVVAQLYGGEQDLATVDMARRWLLSRLDQPTDAIYREICQKVAPLRIVDKSPIYTVSKHYLNRIAEVFPEARYIHLTRHPRSQGASMIALADGLMAARNNSYDFSVFPPALDPQFMWFAIQKNTMEFLAGVPAKRKLTLRGEDLLAEPRDRLAAVADWLGMDSGAAAIEMMMHPEESVYSHPGPFGAHLGNDLNFLRSPGYRPQPEKREESLLGPLDWRADGQGLQPHVRHMARQLGYQ